MMQMRLLAIAFAVLFPALSWAQMQPSGHFTPGHAVKALNTTGSAAGDAGGANGGPPGVGLTELGITNTGLPFCINSGPTTLPYYQICLGASSQGGGLIAYEAKNGAPQLPLSIDVNGSFSQYPGNGQGNVLGPSTSVLNDFACWNNTVGTLLRDCVGVAGPSSAVADNFASFNGTSGGVIKDSGIGSATLLPHVASNAALAAKAATAGLSVVRDDYASGNNAGPLQFAAQTGTCAANTMVNDGGSCVNDGLGNSWKALHQAGGASVKQWGALPGAQISSPLQAAINWACGTHIPVLIPFTGTPYLLNGSITIGNGSVSQFSTCNGITVKGVNAYGDSTSAVGMFQLIKLTASVPVVITVQGPAQNVNLLNIGIDCDSLCATGFKFDTAFVSENGWLSVWDQTGPAFWVTSTPSNNSGVSNEVNWYHDWVADRPQVGGSGLMLGATAAADCFTGWSSINNTFDNMVLGFDSSTASTYGVALGFVTQTTMRKITSLYTPAPGHSGTFGSPVTVLPPTGTGCSAFPTDVVIEHPVMQGDFLVDGGWSPTIGGGIHIIDWSTVWSGFPTFSNTTVNALWLFGNDTKGNTFPRQGGWTVADASGAGLTFAGSDRDWYRQGQTCTVILSITYPVTADGSVAGVQGIPALCQPLVTSLSIAGGAAVFTDLGLPVSLLCNAAVPIVCQFYNDSGVAYTNAGVSGKNFRFQFTYLANPIP